MDDTLIVVEGYVATPADDTDLRRDVWSFALDQRAFGPRRLVVAFTDHAGRLLSLAHARRTDPPDAALEACIKHLGQGAAAAVAFCDEPVADGPAPVSLLVRYALAALMAERYGIHLVDWISCDDTLMCSTRLSFDPRGEWWNVPQEPIGRSRPAGETRWVPRGNVKRRR